MRSYDTLTETFETRCWHYFLYIMKFPECKFQRCYTILETESIQKMRIKVRDREIDHCLHCLGPIASWIGNPRLFTLGVKNCSLRIPYDCPGWNGSLNWAPACETKTRGFDSQSGHKLGLWVKSPVEGTQEATTHWCFSPLFLPPFLSL